MRVRVAGRAGGFSKEKWKLREFASSNELCGFAVVTMMAETIINLIWFVEVQQCVLQLHRRWYGWRQRHHQEESGSRKKRARYADCCFACETRDNVAPIKGHGNCLRFGYVRPTMMMMIGAADCHAWYQRCYYRLMCIVKFRGKQSVIGCSMWQSVVILYVSGTCTDFFEFISQDMTDLCEITFRNHKIIFEDNSVRSQFHEKFGTFVFI